jgi:hypothetical protein
METKNAMISWADIRMSDAGLLNIKLILNYGGTRQTFDKLLSAGIDQESYNGGTFIHRLLDAVGVQSWLQLINHAVRVIIDEGELCDIGHFIYEDWVHLADNRLSKSNARQSREGENYGENSF